MKLKTTITTLLAATAATGIALAADDAAADKGKGKGKGKGERPDGPPAEVIKKFDKDGDGKLNEAERAEARKNRPPRPEGEGKPGERPRGGGGGEMFKKADKNQDGKLTEDEVPEQAWSRLSRADKNGDGAITEDEIMAVRGAGGGGDRPRGGNGERLKEMDANGDGNLSKDEVPERAWQFLSRADKNGDDVLSKSELEAMRAAAGNREGRGERGGKGGEGGGKGRGGADMFGNLDKNKDDKLTEDEVPEQVWARLSKADKDADGAVSKSEMEALRSAGRGGSAGDADAGKPKRPKIES